MKENQIEAIAKTAHTANRIFCLGIGDASQKTWEDATEDQRKSSIDGVAFIVANPDTTSEQLHQNWMENKAKEGWTYGDAKDEVAKKHPSMVEYKYLSDKQKLKDHLYRCIVDNTIRLLKQEQDETLEVTENIAGDAGDAANTGT